MKYRFETPPSGNPGGGKRAPAKRGAPASRVYRKTRHRKKRPFLMAVLYVFALGMLTSLFLGSYVMINSLQFIGGEKAMVLEEYMFQQDKTTIIYAYKDAKKKEAVPIARLHGEENRIWVPLANIPVNLQNAFIALEDKRFYSHQGVDWRRTISSATYYRMSQGGSTLTQQLIKNLTNEKDVTVVRKINEIRTALNLEKNYEKEDILEAYLNTAYMGNGCYGIQTASETYFGKNVQDLNLAECALISTITNEPTTYDPLRNPDKAKARQMVCLGNMLEQGLIKQEEYDKASKKKLVYTNSKGYKPSKSNTAVTAGNDEITSNFVDFVIEDVKKGLMTEYGYTAEQAINAIYYKGLKIYTTMDMEAQKAAEQTFKEKKGLPAADVKKGVQASITMMDYEGHVVAMVGQLGEKPGSRSLNRATTLRQPGSTFKPLGTYSVGIENNLVYWSKTYQDRAPLTLAGKPWPQNFNGSYGSGGWVTAQYALRESLNTIPVNIVVNEVGLETSYKWLTENLHFTSLNADIDRYSPSALALGGMDTGVSTLEMCAAYATIGNNGKYYKPTSYFKVIQTKDDEDIILLESGTKSERAMKPETAELTRRILQTISRGAYTMPKSTSRFNTFMKTGTTTGRKDRWFALGFPKYVAVMWYGFDTPAQTTEPGFNPAGKLGFDTFNKISASFPDKDFKSTGKLFQRAYCTQTGLLASASCKKGYGWYTPFLVPATCSGCKGDSKSDDKTSTKPTTKPTKPVTTRKPND